MLLRILKEPILHFLVIGFALFALYGLTNDAPPQSQQNEIVVTPTVAARLATQFEASWRRAPSAEELASLIDTYVEEEVLVREAKTLALDQGDTVIRQRLQQKMQFITKSAAAAIEPSEEDLRDFLAKNEDRYAKPGMIAFEQVFLGTSPNPENVAQILEDLGSGGDPAALGVANLIPNRFDAMGPRQIDGTLGPGVAAALRDLEPGQWAGPVRSGYGFHLMKVTQRTHATLPEFDVIRDKVLIDWRAGMEQSLAEKQLEAIRARYSVSVPGSEDIEAILK